MTLEEAEEAAEAIFERFEEYREAGEFVGGGGVGRGGLEPAPGR